jgi:hypothetical protein
MKLVQAKNLKPEQYKKSKRLAATQALPTDHQLQKQR